MPLDTVGKLAFIHVPKTAGSSIAALDWWNVRDWHVALRQYEAMPTWGDFTSFAITRHPLDRFVSAYEYLRHMGPRHRWFASNRKASRIAKALDFDTFVARLDQTGMSGDVHLLPQLYWLHNGAGNLGVTHLLRFETLAADLARLCQVIGRQPVRLRHINRTARRRPWPDYYGNPDTLQQVRSRYADDLRVLRYE